MPLPEWESRVRSGAAAGGGEVATGSRKEHVARAGNEDLLVAGGRRPWAGTAELSPCVTTVGSLCQRAESRLRRRAAGTRSCGSDRSGKDAAGEEFLDATRLEVLGATGREATLAERARIVKAAAGLQEAAEAKREAEAKQQAKQKWEQRTSARGQALAGLPGGLDLYRAHLADLDPQWDREWNARSSRKNVDAALAAAESDGTRLGRLRVVLSDKADATRYREELGKVARQFQTADVDRALAAAEREREERETRLWKKQKNARVQALDGLPGGLDLYHAHLGGPRSAEGPEAERQVFAQER